MLLQAFPLKNRSNDSEKGLKFLCITYILK